MNDEFLGDRRKALEESFFINESEKLRNALREKHQQKEQKEALAAASGITDDAVLQQLVELNISSDTLAALSLVPLVEVAWADGTMDDNEQRAILSAAEEEGLSSESAALLDSWLTARPGGEILAAWKDYIAALADIMDATIKEKFKRELLGRARKVASSAGGFLGVAKVSRQEEGKLDELARAFS